MQNFEYDIIAFTSCKLFVSIVYVFHNNGELLANHLFRSSQGLFWKSLCKKALICGIFLSSLLYTKKSNENNLFLAKCLEHYVVLIVMKGSELEKPLAPLF